MRSTLRFLALILVLSALLLPLATYASNGPCPDDPTGSATCNTVAPPWYVVVNRTVADLNRPGTGCQPIILSHPECTDCLDITCNIDVQTEVCQWLPAAAGDTLYAIALRYGTTVEQFAAVSAKNSFHGSLNPRAQFREALSVEQVLADRMKI